MITALGERPRAAGCKPSLSQCLFVDSKTRLICVRARTLTKQPVMIVYTMIQQPKISQLMFNSRSVLELAVCTILEGNEITANKH